MDWYKKALKDNQKKIISSAAFAVIFALAVLLWHYFTGKSFEWQSISPVEAPGLLPRLFYSALVYATLGAVVFATGFYKVLYSFYRGTRGGWRRYNRMKDRIWWGLILIMYFVIVPFVVKVINSVISFLYNLLNLILYIFPPLGISLIVFVIGFYLYKKLPHRG